MYAYSNFDQSFLDQRVAEFRDQVNRRLSGKLSEEEFKPLRLQNGVYLQLHAYMLRVAIPYGTLASYQMRALAHIADTYDRGYGHFTTRQNIQFNWVALKDLPDALEYLSKHQMHAIQTSGNCIRNVTSDPFAGVAADEWADPRPTAELIRQWSSLHPEFLYLPRKFKIAISGAASDRAAVAVHDIGLKIKPNDKGELGYQVLVGGGLGRTPRIGQVLREHLPQAELIPYLETIMRVYNAYGRRDNKYKARIKILVEETGIDNFRDQVETTYKELDKSRFADIESQFENIQKRFQDQTLPPAPISDEAFNHKRNNDPIFARWVDNNLFAHKRESYTIVSVSLKPLKGIPGDATGTDMRLLADLADQFSQGELRVTHRQNLVLPSVGLSKVIELYNHLVDAGLAEGNIGEASDMIACPGLDYCALATARSIPLAQNLSALIGEREARDNIGKLSINISGCINACAHHHVAQIGILGLEKLGEEFYQISLGGASSNEAAIGKIVGRGFSFDEVPHAVNKIIDCFLAHRELDESFNDVIARVGLDVFKESLYVNAA